MTTARTVVSNDFRRKLYLQQNGLCTECNMPLAYEDSNYESLYDNKYSTILCPDLSELHHIKPIAIGFKQGPTVHSKLLKFNNLVLLHKSCHSEITYKS